MSESYAFIDNSTDIQILAMRKIVRKIVILRKIFLPKRVYAGY